MSDKSKKNSAVSPVIGTILLVAITVVLIAIITAVVMGLADSEDGKKVGMNAQPDNINTSKAKLILYGGESISELVKLEMIDHDSPYGEYVELWNNSEPLVVGFPYSTKEDVAKPPKDMKVYDTRINVRGTFTDGREVVLLVQPMTFWNVAGPVIPPIDISEYISTFKFRQTSTDTTTIAFPMSESTTTTTNIKIGGALQFQGIGKIDSEYSYLIGKFDLEAKEGPDNIKPNGYKIQLESKNPKLKEKPARSNWATKYEKSDMSWDGSKISTEEVQVFNVPYIGLVPKGPFEVNLTLYHDSIELVKKTWEVTYVE